MLSGKVSKFLILRFRLANSVDINSVGLSCINESIRLILTFVLKPKEIITCGDDENKDLYFLSKRKCDGFVDCLNGADEAYDICGETGKIISIFTQWVFNSENSSEYVIKKPPVGKIYEYKRVYDNANDFQYFDFDTSNMKYGPYFLGLSKSPRQYKEKWEIELPNRNYYRRAALRKGLMIYLLMKKLNKSARLGKKSWIAYQNEVLTRFS